MLSNEAAREGSLMLQRQGADSDGPAPCEGLFQCGGRGVLRLKRVVPLEKQSKRAQKAWHKKQRGSWDAFCPVTRIIPNKKRYDRNRLKRSASREREGL